MTNAKQEFLQTIEGKTVLCADLYHEYDWNEERKRITLKRDYTPAELESFLKELDFKYNDGYGSQKLFGTIWFTDQTWADRHEYDGSEWWVVRNRPNIPKDL